MFRLFLAAALLILSAIVPALAQQAETRRYFGDWLGACRPDGYCSAISYVNPNADGRAADYWFRIGRHAEGLYWEISFTPIVVMAAPTAPFTLSVDGTPEAFTGASEVAAYGSINDFFLLGKKAQAVMDRLMPGKSLQVAFTDEAGVPTTTRFSLNGLTAALIWIDEQQGRLGSERVVEAPPEGLTAAAEPVVPADGQVTLADLPPHLVAEDEARIDACDGFDIVGDWSFYRHDLGEGITLWLLPCTGGDYNRFYSAYLDTGTGFELLSFATPSYAAGWQAEAGIWFDSFDPVTSQLRSYNRGRGIGDCGMRGLWQWTGSLFAMQVYTMQAECDASVPPGEFPEIFRNDTAPADLRP